MRTIRFAFSRAYALSACVLVACAAGYVGCSDEETTPNPVTSGNDGGAKDATTGDSSSTSDGATGTPDTGGGGDTGTDSAACTDTPVDCTKTAGNTPIDDGGVPTGLSSNAGSVPYDIRCTGLYSCFSTKTVAASHKNYAPHFKLYSDGAEKQRWLFLPPGTKIDVGGGDAGGTADDFVFPVGTTVYKEFQLNGKRIETRRIWKAAPAEYIYSVYRWADDGSTAVLSFAGGFVPNPAKGGIPYQIPATGTTGSGCVTCHNGHADRLLSLDAWGLGGASATGVTLASLKADGLIEAPSNFPTSLVLGEDSTGKFNAAMGFYYNNCGFCHKTGGNAGFTNLHMTLSASAAAADGGFLPASEAALHKGGAIGVNHTNQGQLSDGGTAYPVADGYRRIATGYGAGNADKSLVYIRDTTRSADGGIAAMPEYPIGQMPPTFVRTTDDAGVAATREWLNLLP